MLSDVAPIPRAPYALAVGAAAALSIGLGTLAASAAGAQGVTLVSIAAALVAGACLCLVPMMGPPLVTNDRWGMIVLGVSGARTLLAMFAMLVFIQVQHLPKKPVVYGLLLGTWILMSAEAVVAVWLLSRRERLRRAALLPAHAPTSTPTETPGSSS